MSGQRGNRVNDNFQEAVQKVMMCKSTQSVRLVASCFIILPSCKRKGVWGDAFESLTPARRARKGKKMNNDDQKISSFSSYPLINGPHLLQAAAGGSSV